MNIGFIATEVGLQEGGAYMGGNVNSVICLSRELAKRGHDITIITTTPRDAASDPTAEIDWAEVYEYSPQFDHGTPGYFTSFCTYSVRKAIQLYRQKDLDVLTIHSGFSFWGIIGRIVRTLTDCPITHVQYCPIGQPSGSKMYDRFQSPWFSRQYLKGVNEIVGISPVVSESLKKATGRDSISTILPPINTEEYSPIAGDGKPNEFTISYLGSLKSQKGLDILVNAFRNIREKLDCRLKLGLEVRSERDESRLARQIREDPNINVYGAIKDVPAFLAESHLFVVPFRTTMGPADYPIAALEAMSCGVPIVATDVGGLKQLIDDSNSGICVGKPTSKNIERGILELLEDDLTLEQNGRQAREYIERSCSVSEVANKMERLLYSIIKDSKRTV